MKHPGGPDVQKSVEFPLAGRAPARLPPLADFALSGAGGSFKYAHGIEH
jgi:hypothetical protein